MTAITNHPVDSATRTCCGGIGDHTPDCPENVAAVRETWRDYTGQLTKGQIATLEYFEAKRWDPASLIRVAQNGIDDNAARARLNATIPTPAGITRWDDWNDPTHDSAHRCGWGTERVIEPVPGRGDKPIVVTVMAGQTADGRAERLISLDFGGCDPLTLPDAKALLPVLSAAIEEAEADNARDTVEPHPPGGFDSR